MMKVDYSQIKTAAISGSRLTSLGLDLVCLYEFDEIGKDCFVVFLFN